MIKEIKWIYQSDAEEEEFLEDLQNMADLYFADISNLPSSQDLLIFDLHGDGIYLFSHESYLRLKAIWKESLLIRDYRKEEKQYL